MTKSFNNEEEKKKTKNHKGEPRKKGKNKKNGKNSKKKPKTIDIRRNRKKLQ